MATTTMVNDIRYMMDGMLCGDAEHEFEDMDRLVKDPPQWGAVADSAAGDREKMLKSIHKLVEMDRILYSKDCPPSLGEAARKLEEMDRLLHSKERRPSPTVVAETSSGDGEKLQDMIRKLEEMDRVLQSKDCPPPTVKELRLYGLIMRHVRFHILLFQMERSVEIMNMQKAALAGETSAPSLDEDPAGDNLDAYIENANEEIFEIVGPFYDFVRFLEECRFSFQEIYCPLGEPVDGVSWVKGKRRTSLRIHLPTSPIETISIKPAFSDGYIQTAVEKGNQVNEKGNQVKEKRTTREVYLLDILQGLEEMRKLHMYAPPMIEDIPHYREIRKLTTSAALYVSVKAFTTLPGKNEGEKKWVNVEQDLYGFLFTACPPGYKATSFFDELLELESLLKESCYSFAGIFSSFTEGNGVKVLGQYDINPIVSFKVGRSEEKETQEFPRWDMKKQMLDPCNLGAKMMLATNDKLTVDRIGEVNKKKKTREQYLRHILRVVLKMKALCLKTELTVSECRLFWQINKHVYCSLWMHNSEVLCKISRKRCDKKKKYRDEGRENCDPIQCDPVDNVNNLSDTDADDGEMKTRGQYLQEILSLVEEIESLFLDTLPTVGEARHYSEISRQISLLSFQWKEKEGGKKENTGKLDTVMLKHLVKAILQWELEWFKDVTGKCKKVLSEMIVPSTEIGSGDALKWIADNKPHLRPKIMDKYEEFVSGSPQQLEMLDQSLLVSRKAMKVANSIAEKLYRVNEIMGFSMKERPDEMHLEVCGIDWDMLL